MCVVLEGMVIVIMLVGPGILKEYEKTENTVSRRFIAAEAGSPINVLAKGDMAQMGFIVSNMPQWSKPLFRREIDAYGET